MNTPLYILKARLATVALFVLMALTASAQAPLKVDVKDIKQALSQLDNEGDVIKIKGLKLPKGGHLQGVQMVVDTLVYRDQKTHLILSGSSSTAAYYVVASKLLRSEDPLTLDYTRNIDLKPYKHAGGFQLAGKYLVVGVEDNEAKSSSKINIYDVSKPGYTDIYPLEVIDRQGKYKESTAGAVAAIQTDKGLLVAVAGWDAHPIDLYLSNGYKPGETGFKMDSVMTILTQSPGWPSYQSMSFVSDTSGLWLIGFARSGNDNIADLYKVSLSGPHPGLLTEGRYHFKCRKGASFRFGAGATTLGGQLYLLATSRRKHFGAVTVNIFKKKVTTAH